MVRIDDLDSMRVALAQNDHDVAFVWTRTPASCCGAVSAPVDFLQVARAVRAAADQVVVVVVVGVVLSEFYPDSIDVRVVSTVSQADLVISVSELGLECVSLQIAIIAFFARISMLRFGEVFVHDKEQSRHDFVHVVPQIASSQAVVGHETLDHRG